MPGMDRPPPPHLILTRGRRIRLDDVDPGETGGLSKEEGRERIAELAAELAEIEDLLAFAAQHALLVVMQGRDAAGKDGAIRRILEVSNVQTSRVTAFKPPTEEEREHDFLWRVHAHAPRLGELVLFNRSHYEDIVTVRVQELAPREVWEGRYEDVVAFERLLAKSRTVVLKFFFHISKDEQKKRLLAREDDPAKAWKLNPGDWEERARWDETGRAWEDVFAETSAPHAPWHVVPADHKWYRDLVVLDAVLRALRPLRAGWLAHLEALGRERRAALDRVRKRR